MTVTRYVRSHRTPIVVAASGLLLAVGWSVGTAHDLPRVSAALLLIAAVVGGYDVAKKATYTLRTGTVGINTLVTLAALGAIGIGEYWEAAAVVFLFSLGNYLEARTMNKTRSALEELLEMTPDTALVRRDGETEEIPAHEVERGETVIVKPGAKIPVDGTVVDGERSDGPEPLRASEDPLSTVDQAPVTGESAPVPKAAGDEVYAGTINQAGASRSSRPAPAGIPPSSGSSAASRKPRRRQRRRRRSSSGSRPTIRPRSSCLRSGPTRSPATPSRR